MLRNTYCSFVYTVDTPILYIEKGISIKDKPYDVDLVYDF